MPAARPIPQSLLTLATGLAAAFAFAGQARAQDLAPGDPAPDFTLTDLEGRSHRLEDLRGEVVVLEWTSHVCPAVARAEEGWILADTRAAAEADGVRWLQIDSSWFAPALADDVRAWRARLGTDVPYLLDSDGRVARLFGARVTPEIFVVDPAGTLAFVGAPYEGDDEAGRRNLVLAAIEGLLEGEGVSIDEVPAVGCTIKLGEPGPVDRARVMDGAEAHALYQEARSIAGDPEARLAPLARAVEAGLERPWRLVADPAFRDLLADEEARTRVKALLRDRPARGSLTMVAPDEPGEPLVLFGRVTDPAGSPIAGAVVSLYHTDAAGWYSAGRTSAENVRLFGRVATDRDGRYRVRTVLPGHYADSGGGVPLHLHMDTTADGFQPAAGHRASVYFESDPALRGAALEEIRGDGCAIRTLGRNAEGVLLCVHDITLVPE